MPTEQQHQKAIDTFLQLEAKRKPLKSFISTPEDAEHNREQLELENDIQEAKAVLARMRDQQLEDRSH